MKLPKIESDIVKREIYSIGEFGCRVAVQIYSTEKLVNTFNDTESEGIKCESIWVLCDILMERHQQTIL